MHPTHDGRFGGAGQRDSHEEITRLVRAASRGDRGAWEALVARFSGLVWAIARAHRLSSCDAADVAQTTWLRLVEHLPRLKDPERVGSWLATTARHECLRTLRTAARCPSHAEVPEPPCPLASEIDERLLTAERDAMLWRAFGRLSSRDQALLRLLALDPAPSYEEIGAALGMPIGSIGPTRGRALARLRKEAEALGLTADAAGS